MPQIIQFPHPGVEATPDENNANMISWNNGPFHKRKFIKQQGAYVENEHLKEDQLVFWGEWEAQSRVTPIVNTRGRLPKYLNSPFLDTSVPDRLHNTDPYVFGQCFRYIVCKQGTSDQLRNLEPCSIILFGSSIGGQFRLDTVFVVSDVTVPFNTTNIHEFKQHELTKGQYFYASVLPMYDDMAQIEPDEENTCRIRMGIVYRLYTGVRFQERAQYGSMYSFVPCKVYDHQNELRWVFERPFIDLPGLISGSQTQGFKATPVSLERAREVWDEIKTQVEAQKLRLGVKFNNPPIVTA